GLARTDGKDSRGLPLNGYRSYPMGDIFAQVQNQDVNRFTNSVNFRYYPFGWLNARANLGADFTEINDKYLQEFDQGPFGETNRQGFIDNRRTENDQYTVDLGATANASPLSRLGTKS